MKELWQKCVHHLIQYMKPPCPACELVKLERFLAENWYIIEDLRQHNVGRSASDGHMFLNTLKLFLGNKMDGWIHTEPNLLNKRRVGMTKWKSIEEEK